MLGRILSYMLLLFIGVNSVWWMICNDGSGFFTTIGFGDKLISVSGWAINAGAHFVHSLIIK